jgi:hypothetical protein
MDEFTMSTFPEVELAPIHSPDGKKMGSNVAVWNRGENIVYAVASDKYKLIRHEEVIARAEEIVRGDHGLGSYTRTIKFDNGGGWMRATYTFNGVEVDVGGHPINPTLEIFNSYDLTSKLKLLLGAFRLVCTNGLVIGKHLAEYKGRHMPYLSLNMAEDELKLGMGKLEEEAKVWSEWDKEVMEEKEVLEIIDGLSLKKGEEAELIVEPETTTMVSIETWRMLLQMGEKYQERVNAMTRWILFNIITQFITHRVRSEMRKHQLELAVRKQFYGV